MRCMFLLLRIIFDDIVAMDMLIENIMVSISVKVYISWDMVSRLKGQLHLQANIC